MRFFRSAAWVFLWASVLGWGGQAQPLDLPLVLQPDRELDELYDYRPEYAPNVPTFDSQNRPYIRSRGVDIHETSHIQTLRNGEWVKLDFIPALRKAFPDFVRTDQAAGTTDVRVIFDREDRFYTILMIREKGRRARTVMLYSTDFGETFGVVELPSGAVPAEHHAGFNLLSGPPFLMIGERLGDHPGRWARRNRLSVTQPRWEGEKIVVPEPVEVSGMLVSLGQHSGGSSLAATRDGKTHFVWAEVTEDEKAPGTPTFVATYDQTTGRVSKPLLLAYAPPLNNSHNVPGIAMDRQGFLHVVTGSHHGESFQYLRSLRPNDATAWTKPEPVLAGGWRAVSGREAGGQTYVSLVCDARDVLHLVFRHWQTGMRKYPHLDVGGKDQMAALSYQRKPAAGDRWSDPVTLVIPERPTYSIYYQKLSLDRRGNLYLSLSYFDRVLGERSETERFFRRMVLTSHNGGDDWNFAKWTE